MLIPYLTIRPVSRGISKYPALPAVSCAEGRGGAGRRDACHVRYVLPHAYDFRRFCTLRIAAKIGLSSLRMAYFRLNT